MKIIRLITLTIFGFSLNMTNAEYIINQPLEVTNGGSLSKNTIIFKNKTDTNTPEEQPENVSGCVEFEYDEGTANWLIYKDGSSEAILGEYNIPTDIISNQRHSFTTDNGISGYLTKGSFVKKYIPEYNPDTYVDYYKLVMCSDNIKDLKNYCGGANHWNGMPICPRDYPKYSI